MSSAVSSVPFDFAGLISSEQHNHQTGQSCAAPAAPLNPPTGSVAACAPLPLHTFATHPWMASPWNVFHNMPGMLPGAGLAGNFLADEGHIAVPSALAFPNPVLHAWGNSSSAATIPSAVGTFAPTSAVLPSSSISSSLSAIPSPPGEPRLPIALPPPLLSSVSPLPSSEPVYVPPAFVRWPGDIKRTKARSGERKPRSRVDKYIGIKPDVPAPHRTSDGGWAIQCPVCSMVQKNTRSKRVGDMKRHIDAHFDLPGRGKLECRGVRVERVPEELFRALPEELRLIRSYDDGDYVGGCGARLSRGESYWRHVRRRPCLALPPDCSDSESDEEEL
ncbi:hypothetical protein OH77DRAFT_1519447 [Trametes cingulata]|nr:hypothetical protein OH77DRAFT_1519447 [Trametes cingulata]